MDCALHDPDDGQRLPELKGQGQLKMDAANRVGATPD